MRPFANDSNESHRAAEQHSSTSESPSSDQQSLTSHLRLLNMHCSSSPDRRLRPFRGLAGVAVGLALAWLLPNIRGGLLRRRCTLTLMTGLSESGRTPPAATGPGCVKNAFAHHMDQFRGAGRLYRNLRDQCGHRDVCHRICNLIRSGAKGSLWWPEGKREATHVAIASINGAIPMIRITRFRLYASACRLISVPTCSSVRVRKCV